MKGVAIIMGLGTRLIPAAVFVSSLGCSSAAAVPSRTRSPTIPESGSPPAESQPVQQAAGRPYLVGEQPWWRDLSTGRYFIKHLKTSWWLTVGYSNEHHHSTQGLLRAKVAARLSMQETTSLEGIRNRAKVLDIFITPAQEFYVLYGVELGEATREGLKVLTAPDALARKGRHLVGRHTFVGGEHLYLECDIEGPISNPEWGSKRFSAELTRTR